MTDFDFGQVFDEMTDTEFAVSGFDVKLSPPKLASKTKTVSKAVETRGKAMTAVKEEAKAEVAEPEGATYTVTYNGTEFTVPDTAEWSVTAYESIEDGRVLAFVREMLGSKQWVTFKDKNKKAKDVGNLFDLILESRPKVSED